jgi:hypothetical protein
MCDRRDWKDTSRLCGVSRHSPSSIRSRSSAWGHTQITAGSRNIVHTEATKLSLRGECIGQRFVRTRSILESPGRMRNLDPGSLKIAAKDPYNNDHTYTVSSMSIQRMKSHVSSPKNRSMCPPLSSFESRLPITFNGCS